MKIVFRASPGHRDELEKSLSQPGNGTAGNILLQQREGGPWYVLTVARYNSWEEFAKAEKSNVAETSKPEGGWLGVRNHSTYHNDTITDRIAPVISRDSSNKMKPGLTGGPFFGSTKINDSANLTV